MSKKQTIKCPKCDGRGKINFSSLASGKCFTCYGAGVVSVDAPSARDAILGAQMNARLCISWAMEAADRGDMRYAAHKAEQAASYLHSVGTERARVVLAEVAAGYYHDETQGKKGRLSPELARQVRAMIIEAGRAQAAA